MLTKRTRRPKESQGNELKNTAGDLGPIYRNKYSMLETYQTTDRTQEVVLIKLFNLNKSSAEFMFYKKS